MSKVPIKYDTACRALAEAKSVDEVKDIRDKSVAMAVYARQAKNKSLEAHATEIRERAERRLGQMMAEQAPKIGRAGRGQYARSKSGLNPVLPKLADLGINNDLAKKARAAAALDGDTFAAALSERLKQLQAGSRVLPLLSIAKAMQVKRERQNLARAATAAMLTEVGGRYRLICGDISTTEQIEPESVDHIITDPPYKREHLPCWGHLARRAPEWLKPGGSLIMMSGHCFLPEIFAALTSSGLTYRWTFCYLNDTGPRVQVFNRRINTHWKPLLWYIKGDDSKLALPWIGDIIPSDARDKTFHRWGQSVSGMTRIVELATLPGQIVLDPFCGGGSTGVAAVRLGRRFIGMDIDQRCLAQTAARLAAEGGPASETRL